MITHSVIIRDLGLQEYNQCWEAMKTFTNQRGPSDIDEIWFLEHPPIFTQGQNGKSEHLLNPGNIPVIHVDRGGQVTYHGPGQLVVYILIDLKRKKINIREIVTILEESVIQLLAELNITGIAETKAPGVYVNEKKICSVGLRIRRGCSFHGLALNVDMDLEPFCRINPCGFSQLEITQLREFNATMTLKETANKLIGYLTQKLGYNKLLTKMGLPYATN